jgi:hypothetical protein
MDYLTTIRLTTCRKIKSRRMRWAGHVELMGEKRNTYFGGKVIRNETTRKIWT